MRMASIEPTFESWREEARKLLAASIAPADVIWCDDPREIPLPGIAESPPESGTRDAPKVPAEFLEIARRASAHTDPRRWGILYRLLWRLARSGEKHLLSLPTDPDVRHIENLEAAVGRDIHKMHAFLRFRFAGSDGKTGREHFVAWYEPEYRIVRMAAPYFTRRFPNMDWSILTPVECAHWDTSGLFFTPGITRDAAPSTDAAEELWLSYYRSTFNPARVKTKAMQSEMPKKYWRNLPEAAAIADLISGSGTRVEKMIKNQSGPDQQKG